MGRPRQRSGALSAGVLPVSSGNRFVTRPLIACVHGRKLGEGPPTHGDALFLDRARQDTRHALRSLRRNPGFTAVVILTLAVGVAASVTVFSVLNPYLLRPLPYGAPDRLLQVEQVDPATGEDRARFSLPQWADWRERSAAFRDLAAYRYTTVNVTGTTRAERVLAGFTTGNLFAVLGVTPELGRAYSEADQGPGAEPVVVLSHALWAARYGADPAIIGRPVRVDGAVHTVVGVMPPEFNFPWNEVRMWVPLREAPASVARDHRSLILVGRLSPGVRHEAAREELLAIQRELGERYPDVDGQYRGVTVRPLREALNFAWPVVRVGLTLLLAAVASLLLIACVNVASLTLARATTRSREAAVRRALGAGSRRLVAQLLTESAVLAAVAGTLGVALAWLAMRALAPALPEALFRVGTTTLDWRVLAFAVAVAALTPLAFGLAPALATSRIPPADAMRGTGRGSGGRRSMRARRALVSIEVALAVTLVTLASLLFRSFAAVHAVDLGFDASTMVVLEVAPPASGYANADALRTYYDRALSAVAAVPGVTAAGFTDPLPLNHETFTVAYDAGERIDPDRADRATYSRVSAGYFTASGIRLLEGAGLEVLDSRDGGAAVIVSRALAERAWPGSSALGRRVRFRAGDAAVDATVVGVAEDIRWRDITSAPGPHIYRAMAQSPARRRFIIARAAAPTGPVARAVASTVGALDPDVPVTVRPMTEIVRENDFQWALSSIAVGAFGAVALLLASMGIYGVIAFSVARRRRELGIRAAVGATAGQIRSLVVRDGVRLAAYGVVAGALLALAAGRLVAGFLYGVPAADPVTFVGVIALFVLVAATASLLPARRAARLDPQAVLREE